MLVAGYASRRFSPKLQIPALAGMFLSIQLFLGLAAAAVQLTWREVPGATAFVLLFFQIRLIDDIDDHDGTAEPSRQRLTAWFTVTSLVIVLCSVAWPPALITALAATAANALPILTTRLRGSAPQSASPIMAQDIGSAAVQVRSPWASRSVVLVVHEAGPLLVTSYGYVAWRAKSDQPVALAASASAIVLFWISYEIWKWSRELDRGPGRPHGFSPQSLRFGLAAMLTAAAGCVLVTVFSSSLPMLFTLYALALPLGIAGRLIAKPGALRWRGLVFPLGLQLGIVATAVLAA